MLNQTVRVSLRNSQSVWVGKVISVGGELQDIIKVLVGKDVYKFYLTSNCTVEVISKWELLEDELTAWMQDKNIQYQGFGDTDGASLEIEGFTYNVSVYLTDDYLSGETTHKNRYKDSDDIEVATANRAEFKTLKGIKNYILKWTDK